MQLFAVACGAGHHGDLDVADAVRRVSVMHGGLDIATMCRGRSPSGALAFAAISHSPSIAAPRCYRATRDDVVVLFDGLPIEEQGRFPAHDAALLLDRWDGLHECLEGMFSALRIDLARDTVECLLDVLGMAPLFVAEHGSGWVLSNSVAVIRSLTGLCTLDPLGVSSLLTMGWPAGGRTLVSGITRVPGGHRHRLNPRGWQAEPVLTSATVAPRVNAHSASGQELAERMVATTSAAAGSVDALRCPLTAGRDTRVVLALLLAAGARGVQYYTSGDESDTDVQVAKKIASRLGLPYEVVAPTLPDVASDWRAVTSHFVSQTDGMANLFGISDYVDYDGPVVRLGLNFAGPGGEIARAGNIGLLIPFAANTFGLRSSSRVQQMVMMAKLGRAKPLVTPSALETTRTHLKEFAHVRQAEGWRPREILESYYAFERVRYWAATGVQRLAHATDLYSPFISRAFIGHAFSLSSGERYMEAAHYDLLSRLSPTLRDLPFENPWKPQQAWRAPFQAPADILKAGFARLADRRPRSLEGHASRGASVEDQHMSFGQRWFEAGVAMHRDVCLSTRQSPLWAFVHRRALESAFAASPQERAPIMEVLCAVVTAFWYFHGPASERPPAR